jgi:hypothetical protein
MLQRRGSTLWSVSGRRVGGGVSPTRQVARRPGACGASPRPQTCPRLPGGGGGCLEFDVPDGYDDMMGA